MTVLKASSHDLLAALAREQAEQTVGNRNTELFRRARVALEAGYEPEVVIEAMTVAGVKSGLDRQEVKQTLKSAARAERVERVPDGTPPIPPAEWHDTWARTWPRLIGVGEDKRPMQRWQYGWTEPNDTTREDGTYYSVVLPPGVLVLDIDNGAEFEKTGLVDSLAGAPAYASISGKPGKAHVWFRAHPDRPYPTRTMGAWPGADLLVGGMGIANIKDKGVLDIIGDPSSLPMAPDWMQPRAGSRIQNIVDYLEGVPTTIPWIIEHFAYIHGLTLIAGSPKAGKSTLSFEVMRCRESGDAFLEMPVEPGPTLLVTEEGGVSVRFKGSELKGLDVYDRKASGGEPFEKTLEVVADWCRTHPRGLVFIDTLAAWAGIEDENDSAEMQKAIDAIRLSIAEPHEVAVVLIHHARKGGGQNGEAIRGSGAILAAVDHVVELKRHDRHETRRWLDIMSRVLPQSERWLAEWDGMAKRYYRVDEADAERGDDAGDVAHIPSDGPGVTAKETGLQWRRLNVLVNAGVLRVERGLGTKPSTYWRVEA